MPANSLGARETLRALNLLFATDLENRVDSATHQYIWATSFKMVGIRCRANWDGATFQPSGPQEIIRLSERKYVALKISPVVKRDGMRKRMENEKRFIRFNGTMKSKPDEFDCNPASLTGSDQLAATYDHFVLEGPCIDKRKKEDGTLPGELVRRNAKDSLLGLRTLHGLGLAHGVRSDLRMPNLAFAPPPMDHLKEEEIYQKPGEYVIKKERATNSSKMCVPKYLVQPCESSEERSSQWLNVKISDFGENVNTGKRGSLGEIVIQTAHRASEVVCKAPYDHRKTCGI
ncbi:uncharacterized protein IWZ02DRAFT_434802 [Phyllosticta citriasiana]|uniref:uncharacterized protein n=1 Tax=Phyllosticta citriasiana TaxID=595635 RepID=UPI0030FD9305